MKRPALRLAPFALLATISLSAIAADPPYRVSGQFVSNSPEGTCAILREMRKIEAEESGPSLSADRKRLLSEAREMLATTPARLRQDLGVDAAYATVTVSLPTKLRLNKQKASVEGPAGTSVGALTSSLFSEMNEAGEIVLSGQGSRGFRVDLKTAAFCPRYFATGKVPSVGEVLSDLIQ